MNESEADILAWLRGGTSLDVKMELLGHICDGTPLDASDVTDIITETALTTVIHLVKRSTMLTGYLLRESVVFPETDPEYLNRITEELPLKTPLNLFPDMHRRIAAAVYFLVVRISMDNHILFSHVPEGRLPDWEKRYEGTIFEGMEETDQ